MSRMWMRHVDGLKVCDIMILAVLCSTLNNSLYPLVNMLSRSRGHALLGSASLGILETILWI